MIAKGDPVQQEVKKESLWGKIGGQEIMIRPTGETRKGVPEVMRMEGKIWGGGGRERYPQME